MEWFKFYDDEVFIRHVSHVTIFPSKITLLLNSVKNVKIQLNFSFGCTVLGRNTCTAALSLRVRKNLFLFLWWAKFHWLLHLFCVSYVVCQNFIFTLHICRMKIITIAMLIAASLELAGESLISIFGTLKRKSYVNLNSKNVYEK